MPETYADRYRVLHYAGDRTELGRGIAVPHVDGRPPRRCPVLLGSDAFGHPYEVLDVDYDEAADRSTVHLAPSTVDTQRGNRARALAQRAADVELADEHAAVRSFYRPDVWAPPAALDRADLAERLAATEAAKAALAAAAAA